MQDEIKNGAVPLEGDFEKYFEKFDFSIFDAKTGPELVDDHRQTPYFAARFGGGLPDRPEPTPPPDEISIEESRYVEQLLQAYADHTKGDIADISQLKKEWKKLHEHFLRQRTSFYRAESLRVFARASVPAGTFESFQEEILSGVIDHCESDHADGYARVRAVMEAARVLQMTSNALLTRAKLQDRDGICHQLANEGSSVMGAVEQPGKPTTFNSPLEAGTRAVAVLGAAYPQSYDLQRLIALDYLLVHTGDVGGPQSLHPSSPFQSSEFLMRRKLIEHSLLLMMTRGLIARQDSHAGTATWRAKTRMSFSQICNLTTLSS